MLNEVFFELAAVIVMAGAVAIVAHKLRQPLIIAYILTGVFAGPSMFGLAQSFEIFEALSAIGIAFLLFIVGLNLDWRHIKEVGTVALLAGFGQMVIISAAGFGLAQWLSFDLTSSLFLGLAFAFSSTIVSVKLLTDHQAIGRLHGRIAVGILIVQDVVAMLLLLLLSAYADGGSLAVVVTSTLIKGVVVIGVLWLLARFIIPHLFRFAASSQELLFLVAMSWCLAVATTLQLFGFGLEVGALLAGISLAGSGFQHEVEARVRPLRDFFLILFFVVLGTQIVAPHLADFALPVLVFSVLILVGDTIVIMGLMRLLGYHPRTGFLTGTALSQVSEFSFILIAGGVSLGLLDQALISVVTLVALITIAVSAYLVLAHERIYDWVAAYLPRLKRRAADLHDNEGPAPEIILLGYDKLGKKILPQIQALTDKLLILDFDPSVVEGLEAEGLRAVYGDAGSDEILEFIRADKAKLVISAIPDMAINQAILDFMKHHRARGTVIVTVQNSNDATLCYTLGATFVIVPTMLSGEHFATLLKRQHTRKLDWGKLGKRALKELS